MAETFKVGDRVRLTTQQHTFYPTSPSNIVRLEKGEVRTITSFSARPRIGMPPRRVRSLANEPGVGLDNYAPTVYVGALEKA